MLVKKSKQRSWIGASAPKFNDGFVVVAVPDCVMAWEFETGRPFSANSSDQESSMIRKAAWPRSEYMYHFHGNRRMVIGDQFMSASYDGVDHHEAPFQRGNLNSLSKSIPLSDAASLPRNMTICGALNDTRKIGTESSCCGFEMRCRILVPTWLLSSFSAFRMVVQTLLIGMIRETTFAARSA